MTKIYLYRRIGNQAWATCDESRFIELSSHKLFTTKICYDAPLSPDHSGGAGKVVLPTAGDMHYLITKAARDADRMSGANYYTAAEFAAGALLDKVKELNQ